MLVEKRTLQETPARHTPQVIASQWVELLLPKIHVRSTIAVGSLFTVVMGNLFILPGLKDDGMIDLHSAIVEGHVKSGTVGVFVLFLEIMASMCLTLSYVARKRVVELDIDGRGKIRLIGVTHMQDTIRNLKDIMRESSASSKSA